MTKLLLFLSIVALSFTDVFLTNSILDKGGGELNPVVRWYMKLAGSNWWKVKTAAVVIGAACCWPFCSELPFALVALVYSGIILWNVWQFTKPVSDGGGEP